MTTDAKVQRRLLKRAWGSSRPSLFLSGMSERWVKMRKTQREQFSRLCPTERTSMRHAATSLSGQQRHHSITSSARPSNATGTVRPSEFAVFALMTSSIFVSCERDDHCVGSCHIQESLRIFSRRRHLGGLHGLIHGPSGLPSFLAPIGWFWIHLFKPGIFRTTEVCWCPLHSAMLWSWVRSVLLNRMNTTFAPVVMMIFPPCFLNFLVPAFNGETGPRLACCGRSHSSVQGQHRPQTTPVTIASPASCKVHLVRPTCFMYVAKSQ
jgi:hypothetical protein